MATFDLVIIHGPPSPAFDRILRQRLSDFEGYVHVYPSQLYQDHPDFGVRDVANYVLDLLRKHKRLVVKDSCSGGAVRDCLLKVIPSKLSACKVHVIEMCPRHGQQQTLWERQFFLATGHQPHLILSDEQILRWFDDQGLLMASNSSFLGAGLKETVSVDLTATTSYKFEVPSLLVQWECMVDSGGYLEGKMKAVCQHWAQANPCGRVIVLCDGSAVAKGHVSAVQQKSQIISCTKALANELTCPVYGLQVTSTLEAGEFCAPPSPGLLAFLQRRHCIDLHHRSTVYVYSDTRHMQMAERAGVRHIKIGKVLKSPQMMKTCHSATTSPVPPMLRQLQVVADYTAAGSPPPSIPLADHLGTFTDQHVYIDHLRGLREFLFARDSQLVQRFQTQYAECATPVEEPGSRMERPQGPDRSQHCPETSVSEDQVTLRTQISETGLRQIPKWMLGKRGSSICTESTQMMMEKSSSTSSTEGRGRSRHIIYIMTEKELMETAKDILKQAGTEDMIETCSIQSARNARRDDEDTDVVPASAAMTSVTAKITDTATDPLDKGERGIPSIYRDVDMTEVIGPTVPLEAREGDAPVSQKKQRLSHTSEEEERDRTVDAQCSELPQKSDKSNTCLGRQQKAGKRTEIQRKPPDLYILDEIFF